MRSFFSGLYLAASLISVITPTASAAALPVSDEITQLFKRAPPYPEDNEIRAAFKTGAGPAVFFSNLGPQAIKAKQFATSINGNTCTTIFKPDSGGAFDRFRSPLPGQTLTADDQADLYQDFANRFSRIMAEEADGPDAFVLLRALTGPEGPRANSVWTQVEEKALKANPNIKQIIRVNPADFNDRTTIFPVAAAPATPKRDADPEAGPKDDDSDDEADLVARAKLPAKTSAKTIPKTSKALVTTKSAATTKPVVVTSTIRPASSSKPAVTTKPAVPTSVVPIASSSSKVVATTNSAVPTSAIPLSSSGSSISSKPVATTNSVATTLATALASSSSNIPATTTSISPSTTKQPLSVTPLMKFSLDWDTPRNGPPF